MTNLVSMVNTKEVEVQLQRILSSPTFVASPRAKQFLRYCVHHRSASQSGNLKETTIAVEVFNRPPDYNPKSDPIVRVHARRVREKLDTYYRTAGNNDPIRIDLPKGGYVPHISRALPSRKTDFSEWENAHDTSALAAVRETPPIRSGNKSVWHIWLLALLSTGFAWLWIHSRRSTASAESLSLVQRLDTPDHATDPAWSPDGSQLAFTLTDSATGVTHICIQKPGRGDHPVRLDHDEGQEMRPVWSPDGRRIAFIKSIDLSRFKIKYIQLDNGETRSYGPFNTTAYGTHEHAALDWSPDGNLLLSTEQMSPSSPMRLVLISLATGERTALTAPPTGSTGDIDGKFSPDGELVAFRRGGLGDLYVVSVNGEQDRPASRLTYDMRGVRGIAWCDGGRSILFGTNRGPTNHFGIWKIPVTGGTPQQVSPQDFDAVGPALSRHGTIVFAHRELVTALMVHSLAAEASDRAMFPSTSVDMAPALSPDGKRVAFTSTRSGWEQLWVGHIGDAAPAQATHFQSQGLVLYSAWAPDSRLVAFSYREGTATNIFLYSVATGSVTQVTATRNRDITPVFSANGKYLYYSSNDDGTSRIWRVRTDGSEHPEPMFWEAVTNYLPSSDGRWMYFLETGQSVTLIRRNLKDGTTESVFSTAGSPAFPNAIASANGFVYIAVATNNSSQADVFRVSPDTRTAKLVTHLRALPPFEVSGFTVSPDAKSLILSQVVRNADSLYSETFK